MVHAGSSSTPETEAEDSKTQASFNYETLSLKQKQNKQIKNCSRKSGLPGFKMYYSAIVNSIVIEALG